MTKPILYIGKDDKSEKAVELLRDAGFDFEINVVPVYDSVAVVHGLPVLFGLSGKFEGLDGIRTFIENATRLGYPKRPWAIA